MMRPRFSSNAPALCFSMLITAPALLGTGCEPPPDEAATAPGVVLRPAALDVAHQAYLEEDWPALTAAVKEVLLDSRVAPEARANAQSLLRAAWKRTGGRLPAGWSLPAPVHHMNVTHVRKEEPNKLSWRLKVSGHVPVADLVTQVRLVRAPDVVVLDRRAGLGDWSVSPEKEGGFYFELEADDASRPVPEGAYYLEIELANGHRGGGWFPFFDMAASASPVVESPIVGAETGPNPTVRWHEFRSPEYRRYEDRTLGLWVMRLTPGQSPGYTPAWTLWTNQLGMDGVTVGRHPGADQPPMSLESGPHWMGLTFGERRRFGGLRLVRASRQSLPFQVAPAPPPAD